MKAIQQPEKFPKMRSQQRVTIPALSAKLVSVKWEDESPTSRNDKVVLLEPNKELLEKKGLSAGRALVGNDVTLVPVVNFSTQDQFLPCRAVIGTTEEIERGDVERFPCDGLGGDLNFESRIGKDLSVDCKDQVVELLKKYKRCFARNNGELGRTKLAEHVIDTRDASPLSQAPYYQVIKDQANQMLEAGVVEPANSPWASPVVIVHKKDRSWRFCVDYRKLNAVTIPDVYPLPRVEDALSLLEGSKFFSIMDLQSGFWQVSVRPEDRSKTAFVTPDGLYQFTVMPFGLINAPRTFKRIMTLC